MENGITWKGREIRVEGRCTPQVRSPNTQVREPKKIKYKQTAPTQTKNTRRGGENERQAGIEDGPSVSVCRVSRSVDQSIHHVHFSFFFLHSLSLVSPISNSPEHMFIRKIFFLTCEGKNGEEEKGLAVQCLIIASTLVMQCQQRVTKRERERHQRGTFSDVEGRPHRWFVIFA